MINIAADFNHIFVFGYVFILLYFFHLFQNKILCLRLVKTFFLNILLIYIFLFLFWLSSTTNKMNKHMNKIKLNEQNLG